ncbi:Sec-independent protein translocase protein TatB [Pseudorhodoplanes sp.]|jgi:sec-independent protein translocase protein TatB|uniref:Sec-independent protein translocase protein TatB n=1 Tax=Pseudorhodoplanes sp. TaxID=1934341 RepID=UPI002CCA4B70|nr:Sec-independent protein translocase protein TatB [Pseudorhodoplanes sp.]HWV40453.1 Sec-independent protein translocase protein TatB [Pseudorhodoplanes sp.]
MFDIGWSELLVIGVVALIAIGPKELPGVLRSVGQWMGKIRRMASEFQDQFREAMREAEVADLKRQFDEASAKATSTFTNPLETAQKEVEAALGSDPGPAVSTADPGAIEPSAGASVTDVAAELPPPAIPETPMVAADGTIDIAPGSGKPGSGGGAA